MQMQRLRHLTGQHRTVSIKHLPGGVQNRQTPFTVPLTVPVLAFAMGFHRTLRREVKAIQPSS